jgi:hypothetical protein
MGNDPIRPKGGRPIRLELPSFGAVRGWLKEDGQALLSLDDVCRCLGITRARAFELMKGMPLDGIVKAGPDGEPLWDDA